MDQFNGKIAIVTGASSGIGAAIAKGLAEAGMTVVGLARRKQLIEKLAEELNEAKGKLHAVEADMRNEDDVLRAFQWTTDNVGPVHVLVNNAGCGGTSDLIDGDAEKWKSVLDTNVLGLTIASREAIRIMRANGIDGHIVNINSVSGHKVVYYPQIGIYPASKFAVTALTETLRLELIRLGSKIKVTSLSPGIVATEGYKSIGTSMEEMLEFFNVSSFLACQDIVDSVKYIICTPPHVQVTELTIRSVGENF